MRSAWPRGPAGAPERRATHRASSGQRSQAGRERLHQLFTKTFPRFKEFEAPLRAAAQLSLEQWARSRAGTLGEEPPFKRGHRVDVLQMAIAPLKNILPEEKFIRLAQALSLVYGLEVLIVLKDLWGLEFDETQDVAQWAAKALVSAALKEAGT